MLAKPSDPHVRVYCRVRPLSAAEASAGSRLCLALGPSRDQTGRKPDVQLGDRSWPFDGVFGPDSSQTDVYAAAVGPLVDQCLAGYNATVLAYGQTGSGKTHTMGNTAPTANNDDASTPGESHEAATEGVVANNGSMPPEDGVIPRALADLFRALDIKRTNGEVHGVRVRVSYLEIYNEEVRDLLRPSTPSRDLRVQGCSSSNGHSQGGGGSGRVDVAGALELEVTSAAEVKAAFVSGNAHRATAGTLMNAQSSRSHAVLTLHIEQEVPITPPPLNDGATTTAASAAFKGRRRRFVRSKFHFVDLAGSERASRTGVSGMRLRESKGINQGLLALGKVISALATAHQRAKSTLNGGGIGDTGSAGSGHFGHLHVPYRDSKLTRLLQDSLGGNSATAVIACVSPSDSNVGETVNTLKYASKARDIVNVAVVNVSTVEEEIIEEEQEQEVKKTVEGSGSDNDSDLQQDSEHESGNEATIRRRLNKHARLKQRISDLEAELNVARGGARGGDRRQRSAWAGRVAQLREEGYQQQNHVGSVGGHGEDDTMRAAASSEDAEALAREVLIGREVLLDLKEALEAMAHHVDESLSEHGNDDDGNYGTGYVKDDDHNNDFGPDGNGGGAWSRRILSAKLQRLAGRAADAAQRPVTSEQTYINNSGSSQEGALSLAAKILELQEESSKYKTRAVAGEAALAEAQRDLTRDEEIFMDKLKELKVFEDKVAALEEALATQRASATFMISTEVPTSYQQKKQTRQQKHNLKRSEAWLPHENEEGVDDCRSRRSRDQMSDFDAKAEAKMSHRDGAEDGYTANTNTAAAAATLAAAVKESETTAQRAQEAQKAAEDATLALQAARESAETATMDEHELMNDLKEGRFAVASAEQSAQDAHEAAEDAASALAAAVARENHLLRHHSNANDNSSNGNTITSYDTDNVAKNDVDDVANSSRAAVRAAREKAERAEQATALAAAELASAVAAVAAADSRRSSKVLSNDIWHVESAQEAGNTVEEQEQAAAAAAAAAEDARNVAAALEERRRALQALETGSAEATALVRAYRDRVSNLHREVNVLMAVFQATSRTELEECLSRVQSVCGINTDLSRSSRSGHPQHQQKQQKQLMNELRQLLDSRSAELKTLRAQEEEQRAVVALKRRADHREETLRKEVAALEQKSAVAAARAADLHTRLPPRNNHRNTLDNSSSNDLLLARNREQDARTALSSAQAYEAAAVAAWEQAAECAVEADQHALAQAREAHAKAAAVATATREEANACSARARRAKKALSVVERRWKSAQAATNDALQRVTECEVNAKASAEEVVHCAARAAEAYAHVQVVKEQNAASGVGSSAEAKEAWPLQGQRRRGRHEGLRGENSEGFEGWADDCYSERSSERSHKDDGSDEDEGEEQEDGEEAEERSQLHDDADSSQLLSSASAWLMERVADCEAAVLARRAFRRDLASRAHAEAAMASAQERKARMVRRANLLAASRNGGGVSPKLSSSSSSSSSSAAALDLRSSLDEVSITVRALNAQMASAQGEGTGEVVLSLPSSSSSLAELEQKRAEALEAKMALEEAVQDADRHEDALRDADDELEALEAEIQYKDHEIRRWEREEAAASAATGGSGASNNNKGLSLRFSSSASVFAGLATSGGSGGGESSGSGDHRQEAGVAAANAESVDVATAVDRCVVAQLPNFLALEATASPSLSLSSSSSSSGSPRPQKRAGDKSSTTQTRRSKQQTFQRISAMVAAAANACVCARLNQRDAQGRALSAEQANTQAQESTTAMANALRQAQAEHGTATERLVSQLTAAAANLKRVRKEREQLRVFLAAAAEAPDAHSSTPGTCADYTAEPKLNSRNHKFDYKKHGIEARRIVHNQQGSSTEALEGESSNLSSSPAPLTSPASTRSSSTTGSSSHNPAGSGMRRVRISARALREVKGL